MDATMEASSNSDAVPTLADVASGNSENIQDQAQKLASQLLNCTGERIQVNDFHLRWLEIQCMKLLECQMQMEAEKARQAKRAYHSRGQHRNPRPQMKQPQSEGRDAPQDRGQNMNTQM